MEPNSGHGNLKDWAPSPVEKRFNPSGVPWQEETLKTEKTSCTSGTTSPNRMRGPSRGHFRGVWSLGQTSAKLFWKVENEVAEVNTSQEGNVRAIYWASYVREWANSTVLEQRFKGRQEWWALQWFFESTIKGYSTAGCLQYGRCWGNWRWASWK